MLRQVQVATTGSTGVTLAVAHTLGVIPDFVVLTPMTAALAVETYVTAITSAAVTIVNSTNTDAQVQLTCIAFQGRLY